MTRSASHLRRLVARLLGRGHDDGHTEEVGLREFLLVSAVAIAVIAIAFWAASQFVRPAPPARFVLSTGSESGAYHLYGQRYRELLGREGVRVELAPSSGSVENLERLVRPGGASVAFAQGGVGNPAVQEGLVTLAALYYEPLWIFHRAGPDWTLLAQLGGKRVAVGPEGSGTRALALTLLEAAGAARDRRRLLPMAGAEAADALLGGRIDAALFVAGPDAPVIQRLLHDPHVRLMSVGQAEALERRFPYLARLTLPRGAIDLAADLPRRDVTLIATTAYLVARDDFHPALVSLLLEASRRVHRGAGLLQRAGEFPAAREGDFPLSEDAERFFRSGPPFLQRYLPFWVANLVQRLLVLLVPLIAVMIPVMRIFPGVYVWRVRLRVFRWYRELRAVEQEAARHPQAARIAELLARLDEIQDGVSRTKVPLTYSDYVYNLKLHIDLVRTRLQRAAAGP